MNDDYVMSYPLFRATLPDGQVVQARYPLIQQEVLRCLFDLGLMQPGDLITLTDQVSEVQDPEHLVLVRFRLIVGEGQADVPVELVR